MQWPPLSRALCVPIATFSCKYLRLVLFALRSQHRPPVQKTHHFRPSSVRSSALPRLRLFVCALRSHLPLFSCKYLRLLSALRSQHRPPVPKTHHFRPSRRSSAPFPPAAIVRLRLCRLFLQISAACHSLRSAHSTARLCKKTHHFRLRLSGAAHSFRLPLFLLCALLARFPLMQWLPLFSRALCVLITTFSCKYRGLLSLRSAHSTARLPFETLSPCPCCRRFTKKRVCAACSLFQHTIGFAPISPDFEMFPVFFLCKKAQKKRSAHSAAVCSLLLSEKEELFSLSRFSPLPRMQFGQRPCWIIFYWIELRRESISLLSNSILDSDSRFGFWIPDSDSGFFLYWLRLN